MLGERRSLEVNRANEPQYTPQTVFYLQSTDNGGKVSKQEEVVTSCHSPCLALDLSQKEQ